MPRMNRWGNLPPGVRQLHLDENPCGGFIQPRALPAADIRQCLSRFMVLMNSTRRKRVADQSSSIATARTGSKPASPSACQPRSRLISLLYFFDVPLGYANHTTASPLAFLAIALRSEE